MGDSTGSNRGRLHLGGGETTRKERQKERYPTEPPTITAGEIKRTLQDATRALSLDQRFIDQGEIARGGMGAVHRVYERSIGRPVALKFLPGKRAQNARSRDRFLAEAQITGQLEHPNIIPVHELGQDDEGTYYFTMRLVEGKTLTDYLDEGDDDEHLEQAMEVFFRTCDALSFAHSRGVLHRDVKPSNIMVGEHGQVYLMDWGIAFVSERVAAETHSGEGEGLARKTTTLTTFAVDDRGLVVGTYAYMSPEQARGELEDMDARTDVFGLGAVLFRIVARRPPFYAKTASQTLDLATKSEIPDVMDQVEGRLGKELMRVAIQAMQFDKEKRFQSVEALKRAVQGVLRGRQRFPNQSFRPGETIVDEGAVGDDAFYIRKGRCSVYRVVDGEKRPVRTLVPGDVFGETAIFTGAPRNASVEAVDEVELIVVPGRALSEALGLDSWMGAFVRSLGSRFSERSRAVIELDGALARSKSTERVLAVLAKNGRAQMPIAELAQHLGWQREQVVDAAVAGTSLVVEDDWVRVL